jgi:hypothetical protein
MSVLPIKSRTRNCDRTVSTASIYQIFFRKIGSPDNEVFAIII